MSNARNGSTTPEIRPALFIDSPGGNVFCPAVLPSPNIYSSVSPAATSKSIASSWKSIGELSNTK